MVEPVLHVERAGTGPPVVLAHGFGGSARNFRPQQRAFAPRYSIITYDARGHARSPAPEDPASYTERALTSDLGRIVESTGSSAVVGGLSLGAYTALRYALDVPSRVRGLILASFPGAAASPKGAGWATGFADAIDARGLDAAGAEFVWGEASRFDPKAAALIRQGLLEHPAHALAALLRNVLAKFRSVDDLGPELRRLQIPTLIIAGADDTIAVASSEQLSQVLPRSELVVVPAGGHVVNLTNPEAFNLALSEFLDGLEPSAGT